VEVRSDAEPEGVHHRVGAEVLEEQAAQREPAAQAGQLAVHRVEDGVEVDEPRPDDEPGAPAAAQERAGGEPDQEAEAAHDVGRHAERMQDRGEVDRHATGEERVVDVAGAALSHLPQLGDAPHRSQDAPAAASSEAPPPGPSSMAV
jgi:hypothetical protein